MALTSNQRGLQYIQVAELYVAIRHILQKVSAGVENIGTSAK
jgi:hypothetical protein